MHAHVLGAVDAPPFVEDWVGAAGNGKWRCSPQCGSFMQGARINAMASEEGTHNHQCLPFHNLIIAHPMHDHVQP